MAMPGCVIVEFVQTTLGQRPVFAGLLPENAGHSPNVGSMLRQCRR